MFSAETWLALSHPIVVALLGGAILLIWRYDKSRPKYIFCFGLAYLVYSVAVASQIAVIPSSLTLNVLLSGVLYMAAAICLTHGLIALSERTYPYGFPLLVTGLMLAARIYFTLYDNDPKLRFYLLHIAISIVLLHGAYLTRHMLKNRPAEKILYLSFLLLALSNAPRSILALTRPDDIYGFDFSTYWLVTQISLYVFAIIFGLSLILTIMHKRIVVHRALSETDALTGLRNRRGFFGMVARAISRIDKYVILIADIDLFKKVNDTYGHSLGDVVLAETAMLIDTSIRPGDISGRIGGEEFAIFLPDATREEGHAVAERFRQNFEKFIFAKGNVNLKCTISLGVAACRSTIPIDDAMLKADELLYQAKAEGRNRVVSASL